MATTIAKLNVNLTANAVGLVKNLDKARARVKSFSKSTDGFARNIATKFRAGFGVAAGAVGRFAIGVGRTMVNALKSGAIAIGAAGLALAWFTKRQADAIDENAKLSRQLGISYGDLRKFQYAAGLAGVDSEAFGTAFKKMQDTIGAASFGESSAIKAFEQIGLSVADLARMNPAQQFVAIGEAISRIQDPAQRMAAVRDIFGRAGADMINVFEGGAAAIRQAGRDAEAFGLVLSKFQTDNIEFANDRLGDLGTILGGIGDQIAAKLAPYVGQLAEDTIEWVKSLGGVEAIVDSVLTTFGNGIDWVMDKTIPLQAAWQTIADIASTIKGLWDFIPDAVKKAAGNVANPFGAVKGASGAGVGKVYAGNVAEIEANRGASIGNRVQEGVQAFGNRAQNNATARDREARQAQTRAFYGQDPELESSHIRSREVARQNTPGAIESDVARYREAARQRGAWQSTPGRTGGGKGGQGGTVALSAEDRQLLRQVAMNTGKPSLPFAG